MKILIIYPYCLEDRLQTEDIGVVPIGAYYVAALLKEYHYDVEVINACHLGNSPDEIKSLFLEKQPDIAAFSVLHANRWGAIDMARIAKQIYPEIKVVFGGVGASFLWEHFLTHFKEIDFIVIGEGEYAFLNLVRCIEHNEPIENIKGIAFGKGEIPVKTEPAEPVRNLDELPVPAKYFTYQHVALTRGCPGNCSFCGSPLFWGYKVRFHSPEYFVNQLELLYHKGVRFFYFSDDTFTLKKEYVIDICKKILEKKLSITWAAISRADCVNEEILYWMRKAGCIQISYGVESGSEKIRKVLNKNLKTEDIGQAFDLTVKYGILARAYFIYGCPGENWDTIRESIALIHEIKPLSIIFYILDIFPGTALYADFKKRTGFTDDIWLNRIEDIMYFETDPALSQEMILAFGQKLRTAYHENLHCFAENIKLIDLKEFYEMHADFYSRLGMTFSHGDYAGIEAVKNKEALAERLYQKALRFHPDHRAYLGLGIIRQKSRDFKASVEILSEGLRHFPESEALNLCLGITYMNLGNYRDALKCFPKCPNSKEADDYIRICHEAMPVL